MATTITIDDTLTGNVTFGMSRADGSDPVWLEMTPGEAEDVAMLLLDRAQKAKKNVDV